MTKKERASIRIAAPLSEPLLQKAIFDCGKPDVYICSFCCCELGVNVRRLPKNCPDCGQEVLMKMTDR